MFIERKLTKGIPKQRRLLYGVGVNDADYVVEYTDNQGTRLKCPFYRTWAAMLTRCFSQSFHKKRPTYKGCTLEESWKTFSVFKTWMQGQNWEGKELDKDLISWDNKHYGPETCLFVRPEINNLLTLRSRYRGDLPIGVSLTRINGYEYYIASCSFYGKQRRLGYYKTSEEAAAKYREEKLKYINELASTETNPKVRQALINLW